MLNLPDPPPLLFHKNRPPFLLTRHRDGLSVWLFCIFLSSLTHLFPLSTFRFFFFTPPQSPWCYPFGSKTWQLSSYTVPIFNLISCHPILLILHLLSRCHTFYPLNPPPLPHRLLSRAHHLSPFLSSPFSQTNVLERTSLYITSWFVTRTQYDHVMQNTQVLDKLDDRMPKTKHLLYCPTIEFVKQLLNQIIWFQVLR